VIITNCDIFTIDEISTSGHDIIPKFTTPAIVQISRSWFAAWLLGIRDRRTKAIKALPRLSMLPPLKTTTEYKHGG